jgi:hypothetical protein
MAANSDCVDVMAVISPVIEQRASSATHKVGSITHRVSSITVGTTFVAPIPSLFCR